MACDAGASDPPQYGYYEHVLPILAENCLSCHISGASARVRHLETYEGAKAVADLISHMVEHRHMPIWGPDDSGTCKTWQDARWLSAEQVQTITRWALSGAPAGRIVQPTLPTPKEPRPLDHVDRTLVAGAGYATGVGPRAIRCFVVDPQLTGDQFLTGIRVTPDWPWSVKQVTLFSLDSTESEARAAALDDADPDPGYPCSAWSGVTDSRLLVGTGWGSLTLKLPEGTGILLPSGRKLVAQVHYNLLVGSGIEGRVELGLELASTARAASLLMWQVENFFLDPGKQQTSIVGYFTVPESMTVLGIYPRMRTLGGAYDLAIDGSCAMQMHHWDFHGLQQLYKYESPLDLQVGQSVRLTCSYTTSGQLSIVLGGTPGGQEECTALLYAVTR